MATHQAQSAIRRVFEEAFNQGNLAVVDELLAPDYLAHNAFGGAPNGPQGLKLLITMFRNAFTDLNCTIEDEIYEGNRCAARWTMRGTHKGLFMGNPPTGKQMQAQGNIFVRFEAGMIVEYWMLIDQFGLLQQLGIIPR